MRWLAVPFSQEPRQKRAFGRTNKPQEAGRKINRALGESTAYRDDSGGSGDSSLLAHTHAICDGQICRPGLAAAHTTKSDQRRKEQLLACGGKHTPTVYRRAPESG